MQASDQQVKATLRMTFVDGFYSFSLEINHTDKGEYRKLRFKVPKHPHETFEHLIARVVAYSYTWSEGLEFSEGLFQPKDPTIKTTNVIGEIERWIEIGCPDMDKVERALRYHPAADFLIFFYEQQQIAKFCDYLRGSKSNWAEKIKFFSISSAALEKLGQDLPSSSRWIVTFTDGYFFVANDGNDVEGQIEPLNIWQLFQQTIGNVN